MERHDSPGPVNDNDVSQLTDRDTLRAAVAEVLGIPAEQIPFDADLTDLGLKSLQLTHLINQWRRAGLTITYVALADAPTIEDWSQLLSEAGPAPAAPSSPLCLMTHA